MCAELLTRSQSFISNVQSTDNASTSKKTVRCMECTYVTQYQATGNNTVTPSLLQNLLLEIWENVWNVIKHTIFCNSFQILFISKSVLLSVEISFRKEIPPKWKRHVYPVIPLSQSRCHHKRPRGIFENLLVVCSTLLTFAGLFHI
jgi:hypothetical protein